MKSEHIEKFVGEFARSLHENTFVKMTLGNYRGSDSHLQRILVRLVETKKGTRLFFLYRHETRDTAKNYEFSEGVGLIRELLGTEFFAGHLFTTNGDLQLDIGRKGKSRLNVAKPTFSAAPSLVHDREKTLRIDPGSFYLRALGITTDKGSVRDKQHDKWRQINKFVETLESLFEKSELRDRKSLEIVDMGSGKGYLTFATYDYFRNVRGLDVKVTGVDARADLVSLCNDIAKASEFEHLRFVDGKIGDFDIGQTDILIALHACNTATDEAIYKGIRAGCDLIVAAPCCHQEIRPQIRPPAMLRNVLKHGIILEREAESITDGLRALLLERSGYSTRIFEFISVEHTPKNNMIVGTRNSARPGTAGIDEQIDQIKEFYGIREQRLETLLKDESHGL